MHGLTGGSWKRSTLTTAAKKNSRAGNRSAHSGFATYSQDLPPRQLSTLHSVVSQVLGTERAHLNPVREALRADDGALHRRLLSIRKEAGLPEEISALRVFDVIAWMDGKNRRLG
ncbi:DUF6308 family protein [Rhodococcus sp. IEGM 1351]|uniref:DUF6308 family protein n=1 Tax=Rhodococcus sp. IEGM 1351 TaxID=3047089 RepID=UPI0024B83045|nr:DUF6308 family protein [Rhodococcus sp. IEGM 1351]